MKKININQIRYGGWDNCIEVCNGIIDLIATIDVGPRIIRFGFIGEENEFCEVKDQLGKTGGNKWNIFGGHRLWHSPEHKPRSYEPDNTKIEYREKYDGIVLSQPTEVWSQIKKEIEITISSENTQVTLLHRLVNKGAWPIELSAWALTVMAPGGKVIIPQTTRDTGLLPNRMISLWPYTKLNDPRVYWGDRYITVQQDPNTKEPFKIGIPNEKGWAAHLNKKHLFIKQFQHIKDALYPDFGASSFETYTCDYMTEIESLSPLTRLNPGEEIEHMERWSLYKDIKMPEDEQDIDEIILPFIN